ncbi:MAG TPA: DUF6266 family protein [Prolixibacteraceae bacterium]|nr:DUF6266 family protein [Prolixibacteraceae bacterium]
MAEINDIFGNNMKGKVGTVTTYRLRGKTIMRSLPVNRSKERTENQERNQNRFNEIRKFCSLFKSIVIPQIWNGVAITSSGYHLFMKTNSPAFDKDGMLSDPKKIFLSKGNLDLPGGMQAERSSDLANTIQVKWDKDAVSGGLKLRDQLMVISAGEGKYSDIKATGLKRGDLGGSFELPELASAATHVYLFFESVDQRYYSESVCFEI